MLLSLEETEICIVQYFVHYAVYLGMTGDSPNGVLFYWFAATLIELMATAILFSLKLVHTVIDLADGVHVVACVAASLPIPWSVGVNLYLHPRVQTH